MADKKTQTMSTPNKTTDSTEKFNSQTQKRESGNINRTDQKNVNTGRQADTDLADDE